MTRVTTHITTSETTIADTGKRFSSYTCYIPGTALNICSKKTLQWKDKVAVANTDKHFDVLQTHALTLDTVLLDNKAFNHL